MGKYTSLVRKVEEENPQEGRSTPTSNILNVNINNIHSNRDSSISKTTSAGPKDTLQGSPSVEMPQSVPSSVNVGLGEAEKHSTTVRPTTLTTLFEGGGVAEDAEEVWTAVSRDPHPYTNLARGGASPQCIHGTTSNKCAVCSGFVRWLIADEGRMQRAEVNPGAVRREFWRAVREEG